MIESNRFFSETTCVYQQTIICHISVRHYAQQYCKKKKKNQYINRIVDENMFLKS